MTSGRQFEWGSNMSIVYRYFPLLATFYLLASVTAASAQAGLYTPNAGVPERVALMDAMRAAQGARGQFMVKYLKVFKAYGAQIAGAELTPANPKTDVDAMSGGIVYFEQINGRWKAQFISGLDGATNCSEYSEAAESVIKRVAAVGAPKELMPPQFWLDYYSAKRDAVANDRDSSNCGGFDNFF